MPEFIDPNMIPPTHAPQMIRQTSDFDKWRLDTDTIADKLENQLKGYVWDENIKEFVKGNFPAPMNDIGAAEISNMIRLLGSRITTLSELDDDKIDKHCLDLNKALVVSIFMNWKLWDIRKESVRLEVAQTMSLVHISMLRAKGRGEAELMSQMTQINRNILEGAQQQRGSMFNIFRKNKGDQHG